MVDWSLEDAPYAHPISFGKSPKISLIPKFLLYSISSIVRPPHEFTTKCVEEVVVFSFDGLYVERSLFDG